MPGFESLTDEVVTYFETRFGVAQEVLAPLVFAEKEKEIWAGSEPLPSGIDSKRPCGLRILRRSPHGLKPTSAFLQLLGERITASRIEIDKIDELRKLVLGQAVKISHLDGFVALSFRGDVLGCGVVKDKRLRVLIPTGRRKTLLDALLIEAQPPA